VKLTEILSVDRVMVDATVSSKKKTLEEVSRLLATGGATLAPQEVFSSLTAREKLGSTGLGHGVAIPHGRVAGIDESIGAFVRLRHPVDFDAHDGQPVDMVFGLVVPQDAGEAHLTHLAAVAAMFSDEVFCAKLRGARDEKTIYALIANFGNEE